MDSNKKKNILALDVCLLGDSEVGKTSILMRYVNNQFLGLYVPTVRTGNYSKEIIYDDNSVNLQFCEVGGENIGKTAYIGTTNCVILCFDITDKKSFESVANWKEDFMKQYFENYKISFVLFGNKNDEQVSRQVSTEDITDFCQKNEMKYFEVSAKDNTGLGEAFKEVARLSMANYKSKTQLF